MNINLYKTKDQRNVVNKTLLDAYPLTINARADFDILNPEIILNVEDETVDITLYNYLEISELDRLYFIERADYINNKLIRLTCSTDVLETYKNEILASTHQYRRNLKTGDQVGDGIDFGPDYNVDTVKSDKGFEGDKTLILTTIGGYKPDPEPEPEP